MPRISLLRQCTKKSTGRVKSASKREDEVTQYPLSLEKLVELKAVFLFLCLEPLLKVHLCNAYTKEKEKMAFYMIVHACGARQNGSG